MQGIDPAPASGARREGHAPAAPDPAPDYTPRRSAMAEGPATIENCAEDYKTGTTARASIDRHARNAARRLGRGTTALAVIAALAGIALTGCSSDSGDTAKRIVESAEPSATGDSADPSTPDVPTGEPDDSPGDGMIALALDDTASYEDGVEISLSDFKRGISSEWAAPGDTPYVQFSITVENTGNDTADLSGITLDCQREDSTGEEIFDTDKGLDGIPTTHVLPGRTVTTPAACPPVRPRPAAARRARA
ncbi:hypothetical protein [Streptomyces rhizosphaericus]|uniref:DUF4352 domain-containing protein n=1 Tax=Streptomyces rhizosphaericus TaxID=114699 RepID=A0A6G4ANF7_9ACTN|nr:hypothetical protein [Streptomyces rhizosphaericus]NEW74996.1 hypothetical protein [Streptomyces rhizosphaericus]